MNFPNLPSVPLSEHVDDQYVEIAKFVDSARRRETWGEEKLYAHLVTCLGRRFLQQLGPQEVDDHVHDVYLILLTAIRNGVLRDAHRLSGYIQTIGARQRASKIREIVWNRSHLAPSGEWSFADHSEQPDDLIYKQQKLEIAIATMKSLHNRDWQILHRFYILNQSAEEIVVALGLTSTQFRLSKSRAKQALTDRIHRQLDGGKGKTLFQEKGTKPKVRLPGTATETNECFSSAQTS